jgi:hypothetical protein
LDAVGAADAAIAAADPAHVPIGARLELAVGVLEGLGRADWWVPGPRERAAGVLRGASVERLVRASAGAAPYKIAPSGPLRALQAVGLALASPGRPVAVHLGVGSLAEGSTSEAFNLAALHALPVLFVVALPAAGGAPVPRQIAPDPAALVTAWGLRAQAVDGRDVLAVRDAVRAALSSGGPVALLAQLG